MGLMVNESIVTETDAVFTMEESLSSDTSITLATCVGDRCSKPTEKKALFLPIPLKQTQLNRLLLIIGLTILLIIYIITTVLCLRTVKKKGKYKPNSKKQDMGTPGKFSESSNFHPPVLGGIKADYESNSTEQESLMSDNSINPLIPTTPYLGESMITLNKFNDDDDFMGNFDEDGSYIGNYDEYNEEQTQAIQNKLLVFQQMYRANGSLCQ